MNALNKHHTWTLLIIAILLGTSALALFCYQITTTAPQIIVRQLSPVLTHNADPFSTRYAAPIPRGHTIAQRLWIPNHEVTHLQLYFAAKEPVGQAPVAALYRDEGGKQAGLLAENLPATLTRHNQLYYLTYTPPTNPALAGDWVWLTLHQDFSPLALRFVREIDHTHYPGGRLILPEQEQGVLAFTMWGPAPTLTWPRTSVSLLLIAIASLTLRDLVHVRPQRNQSHPHQR